MTFHCRIWRKKRWIGFVRRIRRWRQQCKCLEVRLEVYTTDSDGKRLHKFPLICPLNLDSTHPTSQPVTGHSATAATWLQKWMAANMEHLRRHSRGVAFHHRTLRHRCHMRHEGRVCVGDGVGGPVAEVLAWWSSNGVG